MLLLILIVSTLSSFVFFTLKNGITPTPANRYATQAIIELIPPTQTIHDLGSGFGYFAYRLALAFPDTEVIGYENSWIPYWISRLVFRRKNLRFKKQNFLKKEFSNQVCVTYLCPKAMLRLHKVFENSGYPNTLISNTFALPKKKEVQKIQIQDFSKSWIYVYSESV